MGAGGLMAEPSTLLASYYLVRRLGSCRMRGPMHLTKFLRSRAFQETESKGEERGTDNGSAVWGSG